MTIPIFQLFQEDRSFLRHDFVSIPVNCYIYYFFIVMPVIQSIWIPISLHETLEGNSFTKIELA